MAPSSEPFAGHLCSVNTGRCVIPKVAGSRREGVDSPRPGRGSLCGESYFSTAPLASCTPLVMGRSLPSSSEGRRGLLRRSQEPPTRLLLTLCRRIAPSEPRCPSGRTPCLELRKGFANPPATSMLGSALFVCFFSLVNVFPPLCQGRCHMLGHNSER